MKEHEHNVKASAENLTHCTHDDAPKAKSSSKVKRIIAGVIIVAAICGAAFGIFKLIQSLDYMRPVKDICNIYNNRESDTAKVFKSIYSGADKKAISSAYKIIANSEAFYQYFDSIPTQLEDYYRDNAASGGSDIKMKFDVTGDKVKMDDSQLAVIYNEIEANADYYRNIVNAIDNMGKDDVQSLADALGISHKRASSLCSIIRERCQSYLKFDVTSGYYITGRYVLYNKSNETVSKTDKISLAIIKLNGSWYIYEGRDEGVALATGINYIAYDDLLWNIFTNYIQ